MVRYHLFQMDGSRPAITYMLGGRIEFARMTLAYECEKAYKRRKLQKDHKKLKCNDQLYYPSKFGCDTKPPKPKKKFKAKKFKGKKLKKKAKPFKSGKTTPPLMRSENFSKRRKTKQQNQPPNKSKNKIVGVRTATKKDTLQMNVQSKLILLEFKLMNYLSNLQDTKKFPGLISSQTMISSS